MHLTPLGRSDTLSPQFVNPPLSRGSAHRLHVHHLKANAEVERNIASEAKPLPHERSVRVVYIMGSPRSGSTLLDTILGSHPGIESLGEMSFLTRSGWINNEYCACGHRAAECFFWSDVRSRWASGEAGAVEALDSLVGRLEPSRLWPLRMTKDRLWPSARFREYAARTRALFEAVRDVSGKPVIVDSSKRRSRALALSMMPGIDLRVIHLVRDLRGVAFSCAKSKLKNEKGGVVEARKPRPVWRTSLSWAKAQMQSAWVRRRIGPCRSTLIRYEDLIGDPRGTLTEIGALIGADLSGVAAAVEAGRAIDVRHTIAGNRLRMSQSVRLKPDVEWHEKLPDSDRRTCWALAGWLMRKYGYEKHPDASRQGVRRAA